MYIDLSTIKSGFCDKLKKLTLCLSYCQINNINQIEVFDKTTKEYPFLFYNYCFIKNFKIKKLYKKKKVKDIFYFINEFNSNPNTKNTRIVKPYLGNKSIPDFLKIWINSYKLIKLKKSTFLSKKNTIGIHIRLTDKLVNFRQKLFEIPGKDVVLKEDYHFFLENLSLIIKQNKKKNFFLATDSENSKTEIIEIFKKNNKKIIYNNIKFNKKKFRQTKGIDFLRDLFNLSNCGIIYSTGGGVPHAAVMISSKKIKFIKIAYKKIFNIDIKYFNLFLYRLGKIYKFLLP